MTTEQIRILNKLKEQPYILGHHLGFKDLRPINNEWIIDWVYGTEEETTLQAHRGSYKTTSLALALVLYIILFPNLKVKFIRKNDAAVKEIVRQVSMMLKNSLVRDMVRIIWGVELRLLVDSAFEIHTNLTNDPRGTSQLVASGIKGSMTGQHYDRIFTDDIVTVEDRTSRAEREETKARYNELQNLINRGGRICNSGTPWHKEDAFSIMPEPKKWDCYQMGIMTAEQIAEKKAKLPPSLFAANYELKHIASEDVIFADPVVGADPEKVMNSNYVHIDAAYGGEDGTAFTIARKTEGKIYVYGRLFHAHVDECIDEIISIRKKFLAGRIYVESNGDKGYLARDLMKRHERVLKYWEDMNKYMKIITYLKWDWKDVVFVEGTDDEYIQQILDYNENAEHDDAPDSLASIMRVLWGTKNEEEKKSSGFGY